MQHYLFPDNTVFVNFAWIDRLPLLRAYLGGQGRLTQAVEYEIEQSKSHVANLDQVITTDWFDEILEFDGEHERASIEHIRRRRFGGREDQPLKHLGESQTIFALTSVDEYKSSLIITDDRAAHTLAGGLGCRAAHTVDILRTLCGHSEITAQDAFEIYVAITNAGPDGRSLLEVVTSARDFL